MPSSNKLFYPVTPKSKSIRQIPYPYKGLLAISNDVEFYDFYSFEIFMKYFNTEQNTPFGRGLGLEICSSLFFFSDNPHTFSYFRGNKYDAPRTYYANRIMEYIKHGWIDTHHAFGDFNSAKYFRRQHAEKVFGELAKANARLSVFTNHGGTNNIQNIGKDCSYHEGDKPGSVAYHSDLFHENQVKYVWTDSLKDSSESYNASPGFIKSKIKSLLFTVVKSNQISIGKKIIKNNSSLSKYETKKILFDIDLQNGQIIKAFRRLDIPNKKLKLPPNVGPTLSTLKMQLMQINWDEFYSEKSAVFIYQHLGVFYMMNKYYPSTAESVGSHKEQLDGLRFLSEQQQQKKLLVLGTFRLLRYLEMIENTEVKIDNEKKTINIISTHSNINPAEYFQGLTVYINTQEKYKFTFNEIELETVQNCADETGSTSFSVKLNSPAKIW